MRKRVKIFRNVPAEYTSIFARKPKKGEKRPIFANSCRIHHIFARKPKKKKIR